MKSMVHLHKWQSLSMKININMNPIAKDPREAIPQKDTNLGNQEAKKDNSVRRNASAWEPYIREKAKNRGIKLS